MEDLKERYFDWLYSKVIDPDASYRRLLHRLYETEFTFTLPMDENRLVDGLELRYRFGSEMGISNVEIVNRLDIFPCSVLEMMAALAIRCEEDIMDDPDFGNRTSTWFMSMIDNLGLAGMVDPRYDQNYVDRCIRILLNRQYDPNGKGGLFHLRRCNEDLRSVQIWYQMNWYLDEILNA